MGATHSDGEAVEDVDKEIDEIVEWFERTYLHVLVVHYNYNKDMLQHEWMLQIPETNRILPFSLTHKIASDRWWMDKIIPHIFPRLTKALQEEMERPTV